MDEEQAIKLLKKYAPDDRVFNLVYQHSKTVQKVALEICTEIKDVDSEFVKVASLLHDIGRFKYPPGKEGIMHGVAGAEILRKEGIDEKFAKVCERHIGAGITIDDIKKRRLNLPLKDYLPISKEEKIIAHADNLVFGIRVASLQEVIERFKNELGEEYARRVVKLHEEIESFKNKISNQTTK